MLNNSDLLNLKHIYPNLLLLLMTNLVSLILFLLSLLWLFYFDGLVYNKDVHIYFERGIIHSSGYNTFCVGFQYKRYLHIDSLLTRNRVTNR